MYQEVVQKYKVEDWTYRDFMAFCLYYAAACDNVIIEDEIEAIIEEVGELKYNQAKTILEKLNDSQCIDLILSFKDKYFDTEEKQKVMFDDMKKIFKADGDFSRIEQATELYLKHLIKMQ